MTIKFTIHNNGTVVGWSKNFKLHNNNGPAFEYHNGKKEWHVNGRIHRTDGPAIEDANGNKFWYVKGLLHREDGPAYIEIINSDMSASEREILTAVTGDDYNSNAIYKYFINGTRYDEFEYWLKISELYIT